MKKLITYTDDRMTISADRLITSAGKHGFHEAKIYRPDDLDPLFKLHMMEVLGQERGAGFYCWKPYVVWKAINEMQDGDILMWCDAGTEIIQPIDLLINAMDEDILFFSNGFRHVEWCKMDLIKLCFTLYGRDGANAGESNEAVNNAKQVQASQIIFKVNDITRHFVAHWLKIALTPHMVDNSPSIEPNVPTFSEHRWDQSILCCLQIMYGFRLHWFPSTYGYHIKDQYPADQYPAMFNHHRKRNNEW